MSAQVDQRDQVKQTSKDRLADSLDRLHKNAFILADLDEIAKGGSVQAIPDLERHFQLDHDELTKGAIAVALVRRRARNDTYWQYLVRQAVPAIESDAPSHEMYDLNGKAEREPAPEFIAWAKSHNLSADFALEAADFLYPIRVLLLGETGDQRAIPLLRRALLSPNYMVETTAALGLAQLQDKESIPLIVEACKKAPREAAASIAAQSLSLFDDPRARSAFERFVPNQRPKATSEKR